MASMYCCLLAAICSLPYIWIYGSRTIKTRVANVTGTDCDIADEYVETPFPLVYNTLLFLVVIGCMITLLALYALIYRQIWRQKKFRSALKRKPVIAPFANLTSDPCNNLADELSSEDAKSLSDDDDDISPVPQSSSTSADCSPVTLEILRHKCDDRERPLIDYAGEERINDFAITSAPRVLSPRNLTSEYAVWRKASPKLIKGKISSRKASKRNRSGRITTFMLLLIAVVYIMSFLPYLALMTARGLHKGIFDHLQGASLAVYALFLRSYYIQSAANPFIYVICSRQFRAACRELFVRMCRKRTGSH